LPSDKKPFGNKWYGVACGQPGGFHVATMDEDRIREWWRKQPLANIGTPTGASGFWVLDVDLKNDPQTGEVLEDGMDTLRALEEQHGTLPSTLSQRTGGGGRQYLFKWEGKPVRSRARDIGAGLDTRGVVPETLEPAGYIVLPPSLHPSGRRYVFEQDVDLIASALAPAPAWLIELACREPQRGSPAKAQGVEPAPPRAGVPVIINPYIRLARTDYIQSAIAAELRLLNRARDGEQEETMNRVAFKLAGMVKGGWEHESIVLGQFLAACRSLPNTRPSDPWTERQFEVKWQNAIRAAEPRPCPPPTLQERSDYHRSRTGAPFEAEQIANEALEMDHGAITQDGVARVFAERFNGQLLHDHDSGLWLKFTGSHWQSEGLEATGRGS
jgi:hypothetical protein